MERTLLIISTVIILTFSLAAHWVLVDNGARTEAARQSIAEKLPKPNTEQHYVSSDRCQSVTQTSTLAGIAAIIER